MAQNDGAQAFQADATGGKTIEELQNYTYVKDKKTDEYTNRPIDAYNHCIDAIRYAVEEENGHGSTKATLLKSFM